MSTAKSEERDMISISPCKAIRANDIVSSAAALIATRFWEKNENVKSKRKSDSETQAQDMQRSQSSCDHMVLEMSSYSNAAVNPKSPRNKVTKTTK